MRTEAAVRETMMRNYYCTHCGCAIGLHNENGCACEDEERHPYLQITHRPIRRKDLICFCFRRLDDFWKHQEWSSEESPQAHR